MGGNPRSYQLEVRDRGANQERNHTSTRSSTSAARQRTVWVARTRAAARRSARRLAREAAKAKAMGLQMGVRSVHKALGIYARCQLESHLNQLGHMRLNVWRHRWLRRFSPTFLFGFICAALGPRNQF